MIEVVTGTLGALGISIVVGVAMGAVFALGVWVASEKGWLE